LDVAVSLERDDRFNAAFLEVSADRFAVIALISKHYFGIGARLIHERAIAAYILSFAR
jgi:hypothetical protein